MPPTTTLSAGKQQKRPFLKQCPHDYLDPGEEALLGGRGQNFFFSSCKIYFVLVTQFLVWAET